MIVREFSTKLNSLAKYTLRVANLNNDKLKVFLGGLKSDIIKEVMMRDNPLRFLSEALGRVLKLEAIK